MHYFTSHNPQQYYSLSAICYYPIYYLLYILINHNYSTLSFVGSSLNIYYDSDIGLYETSIQMDNAIVFIKYEDLLSHEPLYSMKTRSDTLYFYFKTAPFDNK